ncbi:MAG: flagellar hook-length control protein FliK [Lachnospiraceae bacterium]|nr:flagellar hook-length control protein FliK [Lachnospiraceae bacterium]
MANTTVTKVSELLLTNVTAGIKSGDQKISDAKGFTDVMNSAKDSTANAANDKPMDASKASRTVVESPMSKEIASGEKVKKDPVGNKNDMAELTDEVAKEASEIMDKIKSVLDVSDEELTTAMENLGITAIDLLDPVSIKELCMELTGTADSISLITNADLYESVKEIVKTAEDAVSRLTAEFSLTDDEASAIFEDPAFAANVNEAVEKLENAAAGILAQTPDENIAIRPEHDMDVDHQTDADAVADIKDTNAIAGTEAQAVTVEVKGTPESRPIGSGETTSEAVDNPLARTTTDTTETFKAAVKSGEAELKGNNEGFEHASRFAESEAIAAPQQTVDTTVNNLGDVIETVTRYSNAEADSIMSQVTESIRVNYSADTTSMEMQLHPASLGTVNMHIASTNGVVTAHILVENEAVRAALESQLITLQQTFEEQGQKVEAVEVSVANYDLNKGNSSASDQNAQDNSTGRTGRVGTRRRINLNDLEEEELENLDEDEKISADMMARSGNSVDYTA